MAASQPKHKHPAGRGPRPKLTVVDGGRRENAPSGEPSPRPPTRLRRAVAAMWSSLCEACGEGVFGEGPFPFLE